MRNGLPSCRLDSFVKAAGQHAEHIYGDESWNGPPPYDHFTEVHRINTGILDGRDGGLTTGHGSLMPDAVGRDEFLGQEWSQSGTTGATSQSGFYKGLPIYNPKATYMAHQLPGGSRKLDWDMQLDEDRMRETAVYESWATHPRNNANLTPEERNQKWTPIGSAEPVMPYGAPLPPATDLRSASWVYWRSENGTILYPDGSVVRPGDADYPTEVRTRPLVRESDQYSKL